MAYRKRVSAKSDIKHFRSTSMRTKRVNRQTGNAQGGIRF